MSPVGTAITGSGRAVPSGAAEGAVMGAVKSTQSAMDAFAVIVAFEWQAAFMGENPVEFDLFANSGLVFSNGLSNRSFGRAVGDTSEDNTSFLQSQMCKSVGILHDVYQPFRQLSDRISVRLNATLVEVEMSERLKSTFHYPKWK